METNPNDPIPASLLLDSLPPGQSLPSDLLSLCRLPSLPHQILYIPNILTPSESLSLLSKIPSHRWTQLTHRRLQSIPSTLTQNNKLLASPLPTYLTTPVLERFAKLDIFKNTRHGGPNHVLVNEYKRGEGIMPHEDGDAYDCVVATISLGEVLCLDIYEKRGSNDGNGDGDGDGNGDLTSTASEAERGGTIDQEGRSGLKRITRILQEPNSLLVTTGEAYTSVLHGIEAIERDVDLGPDTVANWHLLGDKEWWEEKRRLDGEGEGRRGAVNERGTRVSLTYRDVLKVSDVGSKILGLGKTR